MNHYSIGVRKRVHKTLAGGRESDGSNKARSRGNSEVFQTIKSSPAIPDQRGPTIDASGAPPCFGLDVGRNRWSFNSNHPNRGTPSYQKLMLGALGKIRIPRKHTTESED